MVAGVFLADLVKGVMAAMGPGESGHGYPGLLIIVVIVAVASAKELAVVAIAVGILTGIVIVAAITISGPPSCAVADG